MTLYEAIVALKPGQAIEMNIPDMENHRLVEWVRGESCPKVLVTMINRVDLDLEARIVDLQPTPTLYAVLVEGATKKRLELHCAGCKTRIESCLYASANNPTALIDTLQDIALAAGFDLKKITAEAGEEHDILEGGMGRCGGQCDMDDGNKHCTCGSCSCED